MPTNPNQGHLFTFHPLTPERWNDFEALFGPHGACGGCWCMWWRIKRSDFEHQKGDVNRLALQQIVASGEVPGLLAYDGAKGGPPVGWCSVAPREAFPALERSRILKRVDDQPVWTAVCFFVAKTYRRQGLTVSLLRAAVEYARQAGAKIVEGYPEDPRKAEIPAPFAFTGLASAFIQAGFVEVLRRSETRPIMRYFIE
jgi:GNAT superfamily N-acetyltransferase